LRLLNIFTLIIGLFMIAVGLTGVVAPTDVGTIAQNATTPAAVWALAALVLVAGIVMLRAAGTASAPMVIRIIGVIAVIGAVLLPFEGGRLVNWWVGHGPAFIQMTGVVKIVVGAVVAATANP
jgi:hypothetical protein